MKMQEKQLFKNLCSFKSERFDDTLLEYATPSVLGHLFFNRMQAIAYGTLKEHGLLGKVNREFRNSLKGAYEQNLKNNNNFFWCINYLNHILSECKCKYAMLKGAFLCRYYPEGYRTSNDIDILVNPRDVSEIGAVLTKNGFCQGSIQNGKFIPATRKEIIQSKMMRGETVPYIKQVGLTGMKYLEVDINFSLDYKNGDAMVIDEILNRAHKRNVCGLEVTTLEQNDFFIHLCSHLYKEATTMPWVVMKRDMTLYKYCDIYTLLYDMSDAEIQRMFKRAKELNMEKICAFTVLQTAELFEFKCSTALSTAEEILRDDRDFIHTVFSPKDKKTFIYTQTDIFERFFSQERNKNLKEI